MGSLLPHVHVSPRPNLLTRSAPILLPPRPLPISFSPLSPSPTPTPLSPLSVAPAALLARRPSPRRLALRLAGSHAGGGALLPPAGTAA